MQPLTHPHQRSRHGRAWVRAAASLIAAGTTLALSACGSQSSQADTKAGTSADSAACAKIRSANSGIPDHISIAVSPYNRPSEYTAADDPSKIIGLEPDLISKLASCLDFGYTYSSESFPNAIASVTSGRAPLGITAIYITPERQKAMDFVSYRKSVDQVIFTTAASKKISSEADFCGYRAGVTVGTAEYAYLQKYSQDNCVAKGKKPIKLVTYQDIGTIFSSAAQGRIDFTMNAAELTGPAIKQFSGKLASGFSVPELSFDIGIGVSKKEQALGKAVASAVQLFQKNGEEAKLLTKWGYPAASEIPAKLYQ